MGKVRAFPEGLNIGKDTAEPPYAMDLERSRLFDKPFTRTYTWRQEYSTHEWVQMVQTHSDLNRGAIAILAHRADLSVGTISITPV